MVGGGGGSQRQRVEAKETGLLGCVRGVLGVWRDRAGLPLLEGAVVLRIRSA